jgi:hypothetical protein
MSDILIAVDPGLVCTGLAVFVDGELRTVRGACTDPTKSLQERVLSIAEDVQDAGCCAQRCVMEMPTIYPRAKGKGSGNDIVKLATVVGAVIAALPVSTMILVAPAAWKGQVPKRIHQPRILAKLRENESRIVRAVSREYGAKTHNIIDAIGIGLYALRR